jgi:cytochrome c
MKNRMTAFLTLFALLTIGVPYALALESATPAEVYDLTLKAYGVIENLGQEALPAFNDPKGEFVYKDTYVVVCTCPGTTVTHPYAIEKLKDIDMRANHPWFTRLCEAAKSPNGQWVEYLFPKPGEKDPSRKLSFAINVKDTPYMLVSGIYSDTESVAALNATLK